MPDSHSDPEPRVVITAGDLAHVQADPMGDLIIAPVIPWWARALGWFVALGFPLLCLFAVAMRVSLRHRQATVRQAWNAFLCTLLIVSGLTTLLAVALVWTLRTGTPGAAAPLDLSLGLSNLDGADTLPAFPTGRPMTSVEIASSTKPLVYIVTPDAGISPQASYLETAPIGAAVLLMADESGYLLATNRHVVDVPEIFGLKRNRDHVLVISAQGNYARAGVIGRHQDLDLALLWVERRSGHARFRQPVTAYQAIPPGDPVFVLGHPQRLFFTLSNGLVSRLDGATLLQLSAPVSPGNSGGPVYDSQGNLLGVVTSKLNREINPNAENLNFATRADAFLSANGWKLLASGRERLQRFIRAAPETN